MSTKMIDLDVDYIDSRSITQKELSEISAYLQSQKLKNSNLSPPAKRPILRRKKVIA